MKENGIFENAILRFIGSPLQKSVRTGGTTMIIVGAVGWIFEVLNSLTAVIVIVAGIAFLIVGLLTVKNEEA